MEKKLAIFASGSGSNAENIINYFSGNKNVTFPFILCNKKDAYVKVRAERLNIPFRLFTKDELKDGTVLGWLQEAKVDYVILAGFLLQVPSAIIEAFPNRIINIHPALLPKFGGKGMYGSHVHEAVVAAKEAQSGITVHYVNEIYDSGEIILQARVRLDEKETPDSLAAKIHKLEQAYFPVAIEQVLQSQED